MRQCIVGEVLSVDLKCVPCPAGEYSTVENPTTPDAAKC